LAESIEQLAEVDRELAALEQGSGDAEALTRLFRTLHTLKGTCGFFGLAELEAVARKGADPLRRLIDEQAPLDAATTLALSTVAAEARRILECLARRGFVDSSVRAHGSKQ
jgi:two-component system chemotaxis sensor kinase CheA